MIKLGSIWRPIMGSQVSAVILTLTSLGMLVLLTRGTSVEIFGQYSVLIAAATMFMRFAGLNIYFYYRNRYPVASTSEALSILKGYLPAIIAVGLTITITILALNSFFGFLPVASGADVALWASLAMVSMINLELVRYYQSIGRNIFGTWLGAISKVGVCILLGLWLLLSPEVLGIQQILAILVAAQLAQIIALVLLDLNFLAIFAVTANRFNLRSVAVGIFIIPTSLFYDGLTLFDRLTVSNVISYEAAGHYGLASQGVMTAYTVLGGSLVTMFYPRLVKANQQGPVELRSTLRLLALAGGGTCLVGSVAIVVLADLIPPIFGEQYAQSVAATRAMCLVPFALFVLSVLSHLTYLLGDVRLSVAAFALGTPLYAGLNLLLVPLWGVSGAIASLYWALLSMILMHLAIFARRSSHIRRRLGH